MVFQALYSCYGTTANGNTSPVAFGILFGNEDKEGWLQFWKFAKNLHHGLIDETVTIITDQARGLIKSRPQRRTVNHLLDALLLLPHWLT
jgi:hypothetical protein